MQDTIQNIYNSHFFSSVKKHGFPIFVLLLAAYCALIPFFEYESWCGGHDSNGTIFNAWSMVTTLREWPHFPLIWQVDNAVFKGSPYWAFYQPLPYLVIYFLSLITVLFNDNYLFLAMKTSVYLSFLISEIGIFLLLKNIFKDSQKASLISVFGAIIYLLAPYRIIDLYSRNAYAELWVFAWMPFYLLGFYRLFFLKDMKGGILIAISTPCLLLSHFIPSFFFIAIINISFIFFLILTKNIIAFCTKNKNIILWWFISSLIGIFLSSFYIISAMNIGKYLYGDIMGFQYVGLDTILENISWCYAMLDPTNFKGLRQVSKSVSISFQAGQLFLIGFVMLNFLLISKRKSHYTNLMLFLNICTILTLIFLLSRTIWEYLPPVFYKLQFPWRLFLVYSLFCSIIVALVINELNIKPIVLIPLLIFHFYTSERFFHYAWDDPMSKHYNIESWINEIYREKYTVVNNGWPHSILPKTAEPTLFNFRHLHIDKLADNERSSNTFLLNLKPGINLLSHQRKGNIFTYNLSLELPSFLIFKQHFYPSWELFIDSKRSKTYLTEQGYIGFEVPKGEHIVALKTN